MPTKAEIQTKYKQQHDDGSVPFYEKKHSIDVTPEEQADFDTWHAKLWNDCEAEIKTASDYVEPVPRRNPLAEIDNLKADIKLIKDKLEIKK